MMVAFREARSPPLHDATSGGTTMKYEMSQIYLSYCDSRFDVNTHAWSRHKIAVRDVGKLGVPELQPVYKSYSPSGVHVVGFH